MSSPSSVDPGASFGAAIDETDRPDADAGATGVIRWVLGRQRRRIALGAAAGIAWMGALALLPVALGRAIDDAVDGGGGDDVLRWCGILAAVVLAEAAAGVVRHRSAVVLFIRTRWLLERLVTLWVLDPRGGAAGDAGAMLAHAQSDARAVGGIADLLCRGAGAVVTFVAVGVGMLLTDPTLGLLVLVGLPPCLLALVPLWRPYDQRATDQQATLAAATAVAADGLAGLRVAKGLSSEATLRTWFRAASGEVHRAGLALARIGAAWNAVSAVVPGVFLAVVLWVAGRQGLSGELGPGELVTFTGLAVFLAVPLGTFAEIGDVWAAGVAGARRIAHLIGSPVAVDEVDPHDAQQPRDGDLVLAGVDHDSLRALHLRVPSGRFVGVASTDPADLDALADLLARHADPTAGVVAAGGVDARRVPLERWRGHVVVDGGTHPWLADTTLAGNVALGLESEGDDKSSTTLFDALHVAAADDLLARDGALDNAVGEGGLALSGGQRQRVGVARAVAVDAPVLVLIDPTGALDTVTETLLVERLAEARAGRTTAVLSTSPTVLAACDEVSLLHGGRVALFGTHTELLAHTAYRNAVAPDRDAEGAAS